VSILSISGDKKHTKVMRNGNGNKIGKVRRFVRLSSCESKGCWKNTWTWKWFFIFQVAKVNSWNDALSVSQISVHKSEDWIDRDSERVGHSGIGIPNENANERVYGLQVDSNNNVDSKNYQ
jgi:hypothetical protein